MLNALAAVAVGLEFRLADEVDCQGLPALLRGQAPLHQGRRDRWRDDRRRLCAPSGRDPLGAGGGAEGVAQGRVIAVVQPHRYTRLHNLMEDFQNAFNDADVVFVAPVYAAGEEPIEGIDAGALADGLRSRGHRMVKTRRRTGRLARQPARPGGRGRPHHLHGRGRYHQVGGRPGRRHRQGEEESK